VINDQAENKEHCQDTKMEGSACLLMTVDSRLNPINVLEVPLKTVRAACNVDTRWEMGQHEL